MAARRSSRKRSVPYDLNNPINWTAAQLRQEIAKLGINLNTTIPKSALVQIYTQLSSTGMTSQLQEQSNTDSNLGTVQDNNAATPSITQHTGNTSVSDNIPSQDSQAALLQSTMGMVTAMQGAMASLQSTVTSLLQKQTPTTSSNNLEHFYKQTTEQSTSSSQQTTNTKHGVAADSLPHIDVVSETMRKNIVSGKYVNLASLLIPDYDASKASLDTITGIDVLRRHQRDHRLDRVLNISQFFKAFGI